MLSPALFSLCLDFCPDQKVVVINVGQSQDGIEGTLGDFRFPHLHDSHIVATIGALSAERHMATRLSGDFKTTPLKGCNYLITREEASLSHAQAGTGKTAE